MEKLPQETIKKRNFTSDQSGLPSLPKSTTTTEGVKGFGNLRFRSILALLSPAWSCWIVHGLQYSVLGLFIIRHDE